MLLPKSKRIMQLFWNLGVKPDSEKTLEDTVESHSIDNREKYDGIWD